MAYKRFRASGTLLVAVLAQLLAAGAAVNADEPEAVRLAVLGDIHHSPMDKHQAHRDHLEQVIDQINAEAVDAVLVAGDLTVNGREEAFQTWQAAIDRLDSPIFTVPGNRDVGHKPLPGGGASITRDRLGMYESRVGPSFFAESIGANVRVIGINASLPGSGLEREQEQWTMLERAFAEPGDGVTVLLMHYPLFVDEPDEREHYFNIDRASRNRLLKLIERGEVSLVLSAHTHRPHEHTHAKAKLVGIPPVSFSMPSDAQSEGWTLVTIGKDGQVSHEHRYLAPLLQMDTGERSEFGEKLAAAGPFAVLPMSDEANHVYDLLRRHGVDDQLQPLTPEQVIDPEVLTPERHPALLYLSGESFQATAEQRDDIEAAMLRYMKDGGVLAVLSSGPMPFYMDETGEPSRTRDRLAVTLLGSGESVHGTSGFEQPEENETLRFVMVAPVMREADLPEVVPFPGDGDQRWRPMVPLTSADRYDRLVTLEDEEGQSRGDGAVYTERFDFDGSRRTRVLYASSLLTQVHPARDQMIEGVMRYLLQVLDEPAPSRREERPVAERREAPVVSDRVHVFYYNWYGAPPHQPQFIHWQQGGHTPPEQVGSNFYPLLGPYSSSDPAVLRQHMMWIRESGAGVLSLTWWGQDSYEDQLTLPVLDAAAAAGLKVNFHHEPYEGRTPASTVDDFRYIIDRYGDHPAFYRAGALEDRPMFYIFRSLDHDADAWREALTELRDTKHDSVVLAHTSDLSVVMAGEFDGGYTYDTIPLFESEARRRLLLIDVAKEFAEAGKLYVPSIGPGYAESQAVPEGITPAMNVQTRDGNTGRTYEASWQAVIESNVPFVSITSFNEWHEGSQIEPAVPKATNAYTYQDYGDLDPRFYLKQTARWVKQYEAQPPAGDDAP